MQPCAFDTLCMNLSAEQLSNFYRTHIFGRTQAYMQHEGVHGYEMAELPSQRSPCLETFLTPVC